MNRRTTMRDVARHLGLDQSTVSLALRCHPRIPEITREKIRSAALALGYRPDPMLGALAVYRRSQGPSVVTAELAWINRWATPERFFGYREFAGYWRGASAAAREAGFHLEPFNLGGAPLARFARQIRARGIAGVVIPPHPADCGDWSALDCAGLSVVRIGHSVKLPVDAVGCDQTEAAILGFARIHARGYRRIGFVTHPGAEQSSRFRAGFLFAQENTPAAACLPTLILNERDADKDREELERWIRQNRPDAIFTTTAGVRGLLHELGVRVPEDIALAATSILDGNADAGIDQRPEEIGRSAIELLESLLTHGRFGAPAVPRMVMVAARWAEGATLPGRGGIAAAASTV